MLLRSLAPQTGSPAAPGQAALPLSLPQSAWIKVLLPYFLLFSVPPPHPSYQQKQRSSTKQSVGDSDIRRRNWL